jgi:hypothetical protein
MGWSSGGNLAARVINFRKTWGLGVSAGAEKFGVGVGISGEMEASLGYRVVSSGYGIMIQLDAKANIKVEGGAGVSLGPISIGSGAGRKILTDEKFGPKVFYEKSIRF